jgi:hypothetical protein
MSHPPIETDALAETAIGVQFDDRQKILKNRSITISYNTTGGKRRDSSRVSPFI